MKHITSKWAASSNPLGIFFSLQSMCHVVLLIIFRYHHRKRPCFPSWWFFDAWFVLEVSLFTFKYKAMLSVMVFVFTAWEKQILTSVANSNSCTIKDINKQVQSGTKSFAKQMNMMCPMKGGRREVETATISACICPSLSNHGPARRASTVPTWGQKVQNGSHNHAIKSPLLFISDTHHKLWFIHHSVTQMQKCHLEFFDPFLHSRRQMTKCESWHHVANPVTGQLTSQSLSASTKKPWGLSWDTHFVIGTICSGCLCCPSTASKVSELPLEKKVQDKLNCKFNWQIANYLVQFQGYPARYILEIPGSAS